MSKTDEVFQKLVAAEACQDTDLLRSYMLDARVAITALKAENERLAGVIEGFKEQQEEDYNKCEDALVRAEKAEEMMHHRDKCHEGDCIIGVTPHAGTDLIVYQYCSYKMDAKGGICFDFCPMCGTRLEQSQEGE